MARRSGPRATHDPNKAQLMALDPALALLAAVLQQAVDDDRARIPPSAKTPCSSSGPSALAWFGQQLGVEDALQHRVHTLLGGG